MDPILKVVNVTKLFGGLSALSKINLEAQENQIVGVIGPNGAGKTTLFNCLTGLYYPTAGQIHFDKKSIAPQLSEVKEKLIGKLASIFQVLSFVWAFLFWLYYKPNTYYQVELVVFAVFLLISRLYIGKGLKKLQVWAWGITFVFLATDFSLAISLLIKITSLGGILETGIPVAIVALPWSVIAIPFCLYLAWQLFTRQGRELFGFKVGADAICRFGIARTYQNIRLFMSLSVLDNVKIGAHIRLSSGLGATIFRTKNQKMEEDVIEKDAIELLRFVGLEKQMFDLAGSLAYGEQRRLEIARAMASNPKLILLDEPAAGMNPQESSRLIELVRKIRKKGITIAIIEHDMKVMMKLADVIYVLDHGELIAYGTPKEIQDNPKVIQAYLGGSMAYAET
ncbi:ATP-binding cassette domain-containing protein [bacterium]|nr:ATP-binding cassette domain-containing protein [bacterium]